MNLTRVNEAAVNSARMVSQVADEIEQQRALEIIEKIIILRATVFRDYTKIKKITGAVYDKNESVWKL